MRSAMGPRASSLTAGSLLEQASSGTSRRAPRVAAASAADQVCLVELFPARSR